MNALRTTFLMALLTVVFVMAGGALGGRNGMVLAFVLAVGMNFFTYWFSDRIVLRMYGGREVTEAQAPDLIAMVRTLATRANLPMPKVYVIENPAPNAFATGRNPKNAAVAVTTGLMRILTPEEISGVVGHELAHVRNRDILIGTVAASFAGAITMLASMAKWALIFGGGRRSGGGGQGNPIGAIVMMILAPLAAMLIQMAISRSREYAADASGSRIAGDPRSLARALAKLQTAAHRLPMDASPATAHMFIVNPLTAKGFSALFRTHPATEDRIARLEEMARRPVSLAV